MELRAGAFWVLVVGALICFGYAGYYTYCFRFQEACGVGLVALGAAIAASKLYERLEL